MGCVCLNWANKELQSNLKVQRNKIGAMQTPGVLTKWVSRKIPAIATTSIIIIWKVSIDDKGAQFNNQALHIHLRNFVKFSHPALEHSNFRPLATLCVSWPNHTMLVQQQQLSNTPHRKIGRRNRMRSSCPHEESFLLLCWSCTSHRVPRAESVSSSLRTRFSLCWCCNAFGSGFEFEVHF